MGTRTGAGPRERAVEAGAMRGELLDVVRQLTNHRALSWRLTGTGNIRAANDALRHFDAQLDEAVAKIGNAVGALSLIELAQLDEADRLDGMERPPLESLDATRLDLDGLNAIADARDAAGGSYGTEYPAVPAALDGNELSGSDPGDDWPPGLAAVEDAPGPAVEQLPPGSCDLCRGPCQGHPAAEPVEDDGPKTVLVENLPRIKTREEAVAATEAAKRAGTYPAPPAEFVVECPGCEECRTSPSGVCNKHMPF